jgi:hypothetical protein
MMAFVAVLSSACSSSSDPVDATPDAHSVDEPAAQGSEQSNAIGSPSTTIASLDADALAFEASKDPAIDSIPESSDLDSDEPPTARTPTNEPAVQTTELSRLVDELIHFVEQERGHRFSSRPEVIQLEGDAFTTAWNQLIRDDADRYAADYAEFTDIYRAMGVIDGSLTLEEIWQRFGDAGVIGYYEPGRQGIVLRAGAITPLTETILVHELVHALDDQIFGIEREEYDDRDDEIGWTFSALVEGSAGVIEERYRNTLTRAERDEERAAQRALPRTVSLSEFNASFLELQFGRYRYGDAFAAALWDRGQSEIDETFENPPETSEHVIDPEAHFSAELPDGAIESPPADGQVFRSGVWGEAAWAAVLADVFGPSQGQTLADGWGGDRYVAWQSGATTCVRAHIEADTADALDNYATALEEWSRDAQGRDVFYPTADVVRVTACA